MEAVVKFDYDKQQDDELTLRVGEVVLNVKQVEEGWCEGTLNGLTGMFPDNFVELKPAGSSNKRAASPPQVPRAESTVNAKRNRRAKVAFSYVADNSDELTLEPGQIVEVLEEVEEGWWKGSIGSKVGVFPSNFVEVIEEEEETGQPKQQEQPGVKRTAPMVNAVPGIIGVDPNELKLKLKSVAVPSTSSEPPSRPPPPDKSQPVPIPSHPPPPPAATASAPLRKAKVIYTYDAESPDEVTVKEGEVVEVLQFEEETGQEGWWKVRCGGIDGLVPDNFVELLPPTAAPPADRPLSQPNLPEKMPTLPPKIPKPSEPSSEKPPPVGGIMLMPGLPSKSKSTAPLPTLPPKTEPPKKTSVDSMDKGGDDLDAVPRSDILDNRKMKDRPKMNQRRPPSRGSLHTEEEDPQTGSAASTLAATQPPAPRPAAPPPASGKAPWQQELERKKQKAPPPLKQKPKPKPLAKPPSASAIDKKEEEPKKPAPPAVPISAHQPSPVTGSKPSAPTPAKVEPPAPAPERRAEGKDDGAWKEALEKLREEFETFKSEIRDEVHDLMEDLDKERKRRAELEIDIDRLKRVRDHRDKH